MQGLSRLRKEFYESEGTSFQTMASSILSDLIPNYWETKPLGELDCRGVDGIAFCRKHKKILSVVQFKGFGQLNFGKSQKESCIGEIKKYARKGIYSEGYWLVLNRNVVNREMRSEIEAALVNLVDSGICDAAELYDLSRFLILLKKVAVIKIHEWSGERVNEYVNLHRSRMKFVEYIEDVPFSIESIKEINPKKHIITKIEEFYENLEDGKTGNTRLAPRFLVKSGFGFGKTSTLNSIASDWALSGKYAILLPAARLKKEAFAYASGIAGSILEYILPDAACISKKSSDLIRDMIRKELPKTKDWVILIDGIDESVEIFKHTKIGAFWGGIFKLGVPVVLSVRDEVAELRPREILEQPSEVRSGPPEKIQLEYWTEELILEFLDKYIKLKGGLVTNELAELRELVAQNKYDLYYGDIPKRPLFLGMMAEDAYSGKSPSTKLHILYGSYFRRKFEVDCIGVSDATGTARYSDVVARFGVSEACERLIVTMQSVSHRMVEISNCEEIESISELDLLKSANDAGIYDVISEDLSMHSLMQPAGRDRLGRRKFRFAHKSFHDWFLARHCVYTSSYSNKMTAAARSFYDAMTADLVSGGSLP